jgi:hypothetical protein
MSNPKGSPEDLVFGKEMTIEEFEKWSMEEDFKQVNCYNKVHQDKYPVHAAIQCLTQRVLQY